MKSFLFIAIVTVCLSVTATVHSEPETAPKTSKTITVIGPGVDRRGAEHLQNDKAKTTGKKDAGARAGMALKVPEIIGTLKGKVKFAGEADTQGGIVSFFKVDGSPEPDQALARKVPFKIAKMNTDGTFFVKLPAGPYYMGAMRWGKGRRPGPPKPGEEFIFIYGQNKRLRVIASKAGEINELGELGGWTPEEKERDLSNSLVIRGRVINEKSEPFANAVVLLKVEVNSEKPQFISVPTKDDGKYEFVVPAGTYFLIAKEGAAIIGRPTPGSYMGAYGQKAPISAGGKGGRSQANADSVTGANGDILDNVDITMYVLPDPEELKKTTRQRAGAEEIGKPELPIPVNK